VSSDAPSPDWRADPNWRIAAYDRDRFTNLKKVPQKPTPKSELANPPVWASLYDEDRIVVTWWRPSAPTEPRATVVSE
jgi:hypothetical protein